jgi:pimeloyl-ACP methyl ester carboxylesterase
VHPARVLLSLLAAVGAALAIAPPAHAQRDCPNGFHCFEVTVPLDRSGNVPGTLDLPVAVQRGDEPVLLALGGGPGQATVHDAAQSGELFDAAAPGYRIAVFDQRGTGATALDCPAMQRAALTDLTVPPPGSVEECGQRLGEARAFYTTTDAVADIEAVRQAIGVDQIALLGISYGTYVAERYARAHPDNVDRLVLDSVVPQEDVDTFFVANMRRAGRVLNHLCTKRSLCAEVTSDAIRDLRRLVRRTNREPIVRKPRLGKPPQLPVRIDGPALFDLIVTLASFEQDTFTVFPRAVKRALRDRPGPLLRMAEEIRSQSYGPDPAEVSWGLHTATLCADASFPWGSPASDPSSRPQAVADAVFAIPREAFAPFDRATAAGNGVVATCERWPQTSVAPPPEPGPLPAVPTLILNGTWDLSTPAADARQEARRSPTARLALLREVGHATILTAGCAQLALLNFFTDQPLGKPCQDNRAPKRPRG